MDNNISSFFSKTRLFSLLRKNMTEVLKNVLLQRHVYPVSNKYQMSVFLINLQYQGFLQLTCDEIIIGT